MKKSILLAGLVIGATLITGCSSKKELPKELEGVKIKKVAFYGDSLYYDEPQWFKDYKKEGKHRKIGMSSPAKKENTMFLQANLAIHNGVVKLQEEIEYNLFKIDLTKEEKDEIKKSLSDILNLHTTPKYKWIDKSSDMYILIEIDKSLLKVKLENQLKISTYKKIEEALD